MIINTKANKAGLNKIFKILKFLREFDIII